MWSAQTSPIRLGPIRASIPLSSGGIAPLTSRWQASISFSTGAQDILQEEGVAALAVNHIAKRAGLSTMGVYSYFGGKEQVCDRLHITGFRDLAAAVSKARYEGDPEAAVVGSTRIFVDFYKRNTNRYALMFGMGATGCSPSKQTRRAAQESFAVAAGLVQPVKGEAACDDPSAQRAASALVYQSWACTHGFIAIKEHSDIISGGEWDKLAIESERQLIRGRMQG